MIINCIVTKKIGELIGNRVIFSEKKFFLLFQMLCIIHNATVNSESQ